MREGPSWSSLYKGKNRPREGGCLVQSHIESEPWDWTQVWMTGVYPLGWRVSALEGPRLRPEQPKEYIYPNADLCRWPQGCREHDRHTPAGSAGETRQQECKRAETDTQSSGSILSCTSYETKMFTNRASINNKLDAMTRDYIKWHNRFENLTSSKIKDTITKIKNPKDGLNSRLDVAKKDITEIEIRHQSQIQETPWVFTHRYIIVKMQKEQR